MKGLPMTTITFDSEELVTELEATGVPREQARAMVRAIAKSQDNLMTKADMEIALNPLKTDFAIVKTELVMQRWMLGFLMAGMLSLMLKAFL
jgi:hypothetical protein